MLLLIRLNGGNNARIPGHLTLLTTAVAGQSGKLESWKMGNSNEQCCTCYCSSNKAKQQLKFLCPTHTQLWVLVVRTTPHTPCFHSAFHLIAVDFWGFDLHKASKSGRRVALASKMPIINQGDLFQCPPQPHISRCCAFRNGQTLIAVEGAAFRGGSGGRRSARVCRGSFGLAHVANHLHTLQLLWLTHSQSHSSRAYATKFENRYVKT